MQPRDMRNESHVKDATKKQFRAVGAWWVMHVPVGYGKDGVPDFVACINGRVVAVETKHRTNTASAAQLRELKEVVASGGVGIVVNEECLDDLWEIVQQVAKNPLGFTSDVWINLCWDRRGNRIAHGRKK